MAELTFGQKAVGVSFNPSGNSEIDKAKRLIAELIDLVFDKEFDKKVIETKPYMIRFLQDKALSDLITAQMTVVKLLTWKD